MTSWVRMAKCFQCLITQELTFLVQSAGVRKILLWVWFGQESADWSTCSEVLWWVTTSAAISVCFPEWAEGLFGSKRPTRGLCSSRGFSYYLSANMHKSRYVFVNRVQHQQVWLIGMRSSCCCQDRRQFNRSLFNATKRLQCILVTLQCYDI